MCYVYAGLNMHRAVISLMVIGMLVAQQLVQVSPLPPDFFRVGCVYCVQSIGSN